MESAIYVVSTPIGNLSDMSFRALEVLKSVDLIAAEDTRHSKRLMDHYDVSTRMISLHDHNEKSKSDAIIEKVEGGASVALISDAGTPLISDPGYTLIARAKRKELKVISVPGACACISALSVSGLPSDRFSFQGFLPVKSKAKKDALLRLSGLEETLIFYESPRRVIDSLQVALEVFGDRDACYARELTKRYETVELGSISDLIDIISSSEEQQKGEFVLMIAGQRKTKDAECDEEGVKRMLALLLGELPPKRASSIVAEMYDVPKKLVYNIALSMKN